MQRMTMPGSRTGRDRGATTVLVAVLLSLALLGLGAIATDVGSWTVERTENQNGADAAALAVAQSCARSACNTTLASTYAGQNNNSQQLQQSTPAAIVDTTSTYAPYPCGRAPGLQPCNASQPTDCPRLPVSSTQPYVQVRVVTGKAVPPILGQVIDPNDKGKYVYSCSQATWGPVSTCGNCAALTISACEWLENTNNGTAFAHTYPPYPPSFLDTIPARKAAGINFTTANDPNNETVPDDPPGAPIAGSETVLITHSAAGSNPCAAGHSGWDAPGLFGWLSKTNCTFSLTGNEYPGTPGNSPPDCSATFNTSRTNQSPIYLPVYSGIDSATGNYILYGFAAFVVTGWDVQNGGGSWSSAPKTVDSIISNADGTPAKDAHYCGKTFTGSNSDICLYGYFTQALIPPSALPGGGGTVELGADAVRISG